jgi:hypothetical protein
MIDTENVKKSRVLPSDKKIAEIRTQICVERKKKRKENMNNNG